jgi:7,8-didemethyl-8-hydroxy-5-deazariboflavin synthase CofG subunit
MSSSLTFIARRSAVAGVSADYLASHLREVHDGEELAPEVAVQLLRCDDDVLPALLATARALKEQHHPGIITYSRKVFIPLTNLCRDYCGYCTYRRDPGEPGAHTMTPDEVLSVAQQGEKLGCTEALFSLGDRPEALFPEMRETLRRLGYRSTLHYLEAMCELVLRETRLLPHANPGLLSANWIERLRASNPSLGLMLESTSTNLTEAHPAGRAPDKIPALRLKTIEDAGKLGVPFTTGILIGIGETMEDRVNSLLAIERLHEQYGHIQEVIIQNFRVKQRIPMAAWPEPDTGDMLRTLAVARLLLRDMNIQAPPNLTENGLRAAVGGRHQRLGRSLAADARLHQSRGALAASAGIAAPHRSRGTKAGAASASVSGVRGDRNCAWRRGGGTLANCIGSRWIREGRVNDRRFHWRDGRYQAGARLAAGNRT